MNHRLVRPSRNPSTVGGWRSQTVETLFSSAETKNVDRRSPFPCADSTDVSGVPSLWPEIFSGIEQLVWSPVRESDHHHYRSKVAHEARRRDLFMKGQEKRKRRKRENSSSAEVQANRLCKVNESVSRHLVCRSLLTHL